MDLLKKFVSLSENLGIVSDFDFFNSNDQPILRFLSPKELEIYSKFTSLKRKNEFIAGRIVSKKAFFKFSSKEIDCFEKFPSVSILNTKTGSPFIENSNLHISISHSHGVAIASVSKHVVGVDIEQIELRRIHALKRISKEFSSEKVRELAVLWTLKESLCKALKTGFIEDFQLYETKNFQCENGIYRCKFRNFPFSGIAVANEKYALSIVSNSYEQFTS